MEPPRRGDWPELERLLQLGPDEPLEHYTVALFRQVRDGDGYADSTQNLANFIRWTLDARPQQLRLAFKMVHFTEHDQEQPNRHFSVVVRSDPHRSATNESRVIGESLTCSCRKGRCRRCARIDGDIGFGWIGPWTCRDNISNRRDRLDKLRHLVRGPEWCWCPNCFNRWKDVLIEPGTECTTVRMCRLEQVHGDRHDVVHFYERWWGWRFN